MFLDVVYSLLHGGDLGGFIVGNRNAELLFECHHQLDAVQTVGFQVLKNVIYAIKIE